MARTWPWRTTNSTRALSSSSMSADAKMPETLTWRTRFFRSKASLNILEVAMEPRGSSWRGLAFGTRSRCLPSRKARHPAVTTPKGKAVRRRIVRAAICFRHSESYATMNHVVVGGALTTSHAISASVPPTPSRNPIQGTLPRNASARQDRISAMCMTPNCTMRSHVMNERRCCVSVDPTSLTAIVLAPVLEGGGDGEHQQTGCQCHHPARAGVAALNRHRLILLLSVIVPGPGAPLGLSGSLLKPFDVRQLP